MISTTMSMRDAHTAAETVPNREETVTIDENRKTVALMTGEGLTTKTADQLTNGKGLKKMNAVLTTIGGSRMIGDKLTIASAQMKIAVKQKTTRTTGRKMLLNLSRINDVTEFPIEATTQKSVKRRTSHPTSSQQAPFLKELDHFPRYPGPSP